MSFPNQVVFTTGLGMLRYLFGRQKLNTQDALFFFFSSSIILLGFIIYGLLLYHMFTLTTATTSKLLLIFIFIRIISIIHTQVTKVKFKIYKYNQNEKAGKCSIEWHPT